MRRPIDWAHVREHVDGRDVRAARTVPPARSPDLCLPVIGANLVFNKSLALRLSDGRMPRVRDSVSVFVEPQQEVAAAMQAASRGSDRRRWRRSAVALQSQRLAASRTRPSRRQFEPPFSLVEQPWFSLCGLLERRRRDERLRRQRRLRDAEEQRLPTRSGFGRALPRALLLCARAASMRACTH